MDNNLEFSNLKCLNRQELLGTGELVTNLKKDAFKLIDSLNDGGFYSECPCCREKFALEETGLFYLNDFSPQAEEIYNQKIYDLKDRKEKLRERRRKISKTSKVGAKAVNIGKILERLAPCMATFPFERNDCRSLFDPIDYIIFEGLEKNGKVKKIIFTDIKTGRARLTGNQPDIKKLVENKQVLWETYKR